MTKLIVREQYHLYLASPFRQFTIKLFHMTNKHRQAVQNFLEWAQNRNIAQPEFMQAVSEVANAVIPFIEEHPEYKEARIL